MADGWEAATFEGVARVQEHALAATTPDQRYQWLMEALELAAASGALARARAEKQAWCDRLWRGEDAGPEP